MAAEWLSRRRSVLPSSETTQESSEPRLFPYKSAKQTEKVFAKSPVISGVAGTFSFFDVKTEHFTNKVIDLRINISSVGGHRRRLLMN